MTIGDLAQIVITVVCTAVALIGGYIIYRLTKRDTVIVQKYGGDLLAVKEALAILSRIAMKMRTWPLTRSDMESMGLEGAMTTIYDAKAHLVNITGPLTVVWTLCVSLKATAYPEAGRGDFRLEVDERGRVDENQLSEILRSTTNTVVRQHVGATELEQRIERVRVNMDKYWK